MGEINHIFLVITPRHSSQEGQLISTHYAEPSLLEQVFSHLVPVVSKVSHATHSYSNPSH